MTADLDIYRTANVLIKEHAEDAALEAAKRAALVLKAVANLGVFGLVTHSIGSVLSSLRSLRQALQINFSLSSERTLT